MLLANRSQARQAVLVSPIQRRNNPVIIQVDGAVLSLMAILPGQQKDGRLAWRLR
jgi:phosphatidylserine decarboxylase